MNSAYKLKSASGAGNSKGIARLASEEEETCVLLLGVSCFLLISVNIIEESLAAVDGMLHIVDDIQAVIGIDVIVKVDLHIIQIAAEEIFSLHREKKPPERCKGRICDNFIESAAQRKNHTYHPQNCLVNLQISCYDKNIAPGSCYRSRAFLRVRRIFVYTMKDVCRETGMGYETLKFYCNEGLIPNVKRNQNNYRVFDDRDVAWIKSLSCLKNCGMSIQETREYIDLCLKGAASIPERKVILAQKREELLIKMAEIQGSIDYIDNKQLFYDDVLAGKVEYHSNLMPQNDKE